MSKEYLTYLNKIKYVETIDLAFAELMGRLAATNEPLTGLAAALVCHATRQGHVCLDLGAPLDIGSGDFQAEPEPPPLELPPSREWRQRLADSRVVGRPGDFRPMILDGARLYLHRYWTYEQVIAGYLLEQTVAGELLASGSDPTDDIPGTLDAHQAAAVQLARQRKFCVISGGPGTGKTHTLAQIILKLQRHACGMPLRIKLAAPTGKAAARLQEAIEAGLKQADREAGDAFTTGMEKAQTLHRLLGIDPVSGRSRYHAAKPLPADVVIVDEASMIDISMMAKLILAMPLSARLILSGDKDQLSSVEAGAVLGDICFGLSPSRQRGKDSDTASSGEAGLDGKVPIVLLRRNFRFGARSGIQALSRAVNQGDGIRTNALLEDPAYPDVAFHEADRWEDLASFLEQEIRREVAPWFEANDPMERIGQLDHFKILTVVRNGPYGVNRMNLLVETVLARMGLIPVRRSEGVHWYPGRPVMILRNDHAHGLFNGDVGVAVPRANGDAAAIKVAFSDARKGLRHFAVHQLPPHETAYAMTVHKSQGSEFRRVLLVLPEQDMPLLTRELLYTALTRARDSVVIIGRAGLTGAAVKRPTRRTSGLREKIRCSFE